jgi:hypothetical protein
MLTSTELEAKGSNYLQEQGIEPHCHNPKIKLRNTKEAMIADA